MSKLLGVIADFKVLIAYIEPNWDLGSYIKDISTMIGERSRDPLGVKYLIIIGKEAPDINGHNWKPFEMDTKGSATPIS